MGKYHLDIGDFSITAGEPEISFRGEFILGAPLCPTVLTLKAAKFKNPTVRKVLSKIHQMFHDAPPATRKAVIRDLQMFLTEEISLRELAKRAGTRYREMMLRRRALWLAPLSYIVRRVGNDYILAVPNEDKVVFITPLDARETSNLTLAKEIIFSQNPKRRLKRLRKAERKTCASIVSKYGFMKRNFPEAFAVLLSKILLEVKNEPDFPCLRGLVIRPSEEKEFEILPAKRSKIDNHGRNTTHPRLQQARR